MSEGLAVGRIVHYVLDAGPHQGEHRPAIVVRVWQEATVSCNIQVFTDGENDNFLEAHVHTPADSLIKRSQNVIWRTSVFQDEETKKPGTWHWPEREA